MSSFGDWLYTCDRGLTTEAYSEAPAEGVETCDCNGCRNFVLVRERVFPSAFIELLRSLGIDPHKDGEVYRNGQLAQGRHDYGGWFHFVSSLNRTADFPVVDFGGGFTAWMCQRSAPALETLRGQSLEFHATAVPWDLNEPEPK